MSQQTEFLDYIPPHRKELYFKLIDGIQNFLPITDRLFFLDDHFPPDKLDAALKWLIKNNIVGYQFLNYFHQQCGKSDLELHRRLLQVVDNAPLAKVIAGKNFKT